MRKYMTFVLLLVLFFSLPHALVMAEDENPDMSEEVMELEASLPSLEAIISAQPQLMGWDMTEFFELFENCEVTNWNVGPNYLDVEIADLCWPDSSSGWLYHGNGGYIWAEYQLTLDSAFPYYEGEPTYYGFIGALQFCDFEGSCLSDDPEDFQYFVSIGNEALWSHFAVAYPESFSPDWRLAPNQPPEILEAITEISENSPDEEQCE